jgi:hypothetical protein
MDLEKLKYPIGKFQYIEPITPAQKKTWILQIEALPEKLIPTVDVLTEAQLDTPYRPQGWTVRQVIHHIADSHANACIRFPLALTEHNPVIKPYQEELWAELEFQKQLPISNSLQLIKLLHQRWVALLNTMTEDDFARAYKHPQYGKEYSLTEALGLYAWHGNHHLAHITNLINRNFDL